MSATKELFTDLQEKTYSKLEDIGVPRETIYDFEEMFSGYDFQDFAEKMAGYVMTIYFLSETTGYEQSLLWNIWKEHVQDFMDGGEVSTLERQWESFKATTQEKDWQGEWRKKEVKRGGNDMPFNSFSDDNPLNSAGATACIKRIEREFRVLHGGDENDQIMERTCIPGKYYLVLCYNRNGNRGNIYRKKISLSDMEVSDCATYFLGISGGDSFNIEANSWTTDGYAPRASLHFHNF